MSNFVIKAEKREKLGSLEANRIKKSGKIPAVIQTGAGNINISLDKREFDIELKKGNIQSRIAEIEVGDKKYKTIASKLELDPVSDDVIHIDLRNIEINRDIKSWPKLKFIGRDKSPGIKRGGFLNIRLRKVEVICASENDISEEVEVNISQMRVGDKLWSDELNLAGNNKLSAKNKFLVASITGRGKSEDDEAKTGEVSEAASEKKED